MRGDFSRTTHRPNRHYSRVLLQQGRVLLDADWNEQVAIQLLAMRQMLRDLIGPHGGPVDALGFSVEFAEPEEDKLVLAVGNGFSNSDGFGDHPKLGRYYVDGIMVEHETTQEAETSLVETGVSVRAAVSVFVYLEVWEHHLTWIEENQAFKNRSMREVALGGPDTASRAQVRWAIRTEIARSGPESEDFDPDTWSRDRVRELAKRRIGLAAGLTTQDIGAGDPCRDTAQPRYRGPENRLYRVEIHEITDEGPTFKWSRENGSVVFPIERDVVSFKEGQLTLALGLGRDSRYTLSKGDIVELVTAELDAAGDAGPLFEVVGVDESARTVDLSTLAPELALELPLGDWALLRRWDQPLDPKKDNGGLAKTLHGAIRIDGTDKFVLEDGIVVKFKLPDLAKAQQAKSNSVNRRDAAKAADAARNAARSVDEPKSDEQSPPNEEQEVEVGFEVCRVGDYWLIPARTIPGDVEWPSETFEPPHGVARHFAPLAMVQQFPQQGGFVTDLRRHFPGLAQR